MLIRFPVTAQKSWNENSHSYSDLHLQSWLQLFQRWIVHYPPFRTTGARSQNLCSKECGNGLVGFCLETLRPLWCRNVMIITNGVICHLHLAKLLITLMWTLKQYGRFSIKDKCITSNLYVNIWVSIKLGPVFVLPHLCSSC